MYIQLQIDSYTLQTKLLFSVQLPLQFIHFLSFFMGMGRWGAAEPNQTNMHIFNDGYIAAWWLKHALAKHRVKAILMWAHDCCYVGYGSNSSCPSSLWSMLILMVCMPSQLCKKVIHSFNVLSTKFLGQ